MSPGSPRPARARRRSAEGVAVVLLAIVALVAPLPAALVERWYSRGLYPTLQRVVTPVSNLLPIALLDVAVVVVLLVSLRQLVKVVRSKPPVAAVKVLGARVVVLAAVVYLLFLAMWGLNYRRVPLERKLEFDEARITREAAKLAGAEAARLVNDAYAGAHAADDGSSALVESFAEVQRLLGSRVPARPGVPKRSLLGFYFRWAAIDGMTDPFFLEIIVNPDVLPVERPFVIAHEWAHLAGYADESEANFVAWLACAHGDARARYSGWLALFAHLSNALPREDRRGIASLLDPGPRQDLAAINARLQRSAPVVRRAARDVYDSYLKANRVERGIASYDAVVRLVLGVRFDDGWVPRGKSGL
jgi:Protein of unknown function (DUF3810)